MTRNDWVEKMYNNFVKTAKWEQVEGVDTNADIKWFIKYIGGKKTILTLSDLVIVIDKRKTRITNVSSGKTASARRNSKDEFDVKTGIAIAWARYLGLKIPTFRKLVYLNELSEGDKFYTLKGIPCRLLEFQVINPTWATIYNYYSGAVMSVSKGLTVEVEEN